MKHKAHCQYKSTIAVSLERLIHNCLISQSHYSAHIYQLQYELSMAFIATDAWNNLRIMGNGMGINKE